MNNTNTNTKQHLSRKKKNQPNTKLLVARINILPNIVDPFAEKSFQLKTAFIANDFIDRFVPRFIFDQPHRIILNMNFHLKIDSVKMISSRIFEKKKSATSELWPERDSKNNVDK